LGVFINTVEINKGEGFTIGFGVENYHISLFDNGHIPGENWAFRTHKGSEQHIGRINCNIIGVFFFVSLNFFEVKIIGEHGAGNYIGLRVRGRIIEPFFSFALGFHNIIIESFQKSSLFNNFELGVFLNNGFLEFFEPGFSNEIPVSFNINWILEFGISLNDSSFGVKEGLRILRTVGSNTTVVGTNGAFCWSGGYNLVLSYRAICKTFLLSFGFGFYLNEFLFLVIITIQIALMAFKSQITAFADFF
jgi:hypothetical protein